MPVYTQVFHWTIIRCLKGFVSAYERWLKAQGSTEDVAHG